MKSATVTTLGQPPAVVVATVVPSTRATFPSVADMLMVLVRSPVKAVPFVVPPAILIKKYFPGTNIPVVISALKFDALLKVPALEAY